MESTTSFKKIIPFNALIAAAGSGIRAGRGTPKQYRTLGGKPVLRHTLERFLSAPGIGSVRVIIGADHADWYHDAVKGLELLPPVTGGDTRNISVSNGIKSFSDMMDKDILLIHDAARPFITPDEITAVAAAAAEKSAATLASPVSDTLRYDYGGYADRDGLWAVQTPQAFHYGLIRRAHEIAAPGKAWTDDTAMVEAIGAPVAMVPGSRANFKITTGDDFMLAEKMLQGACETRTGTGFDVHAFDMDKPGPLRLCGVDVPHSHALKGHSDADAGLHALTDALFGALAAGDIGSHFPPSDPQWKGKDSAHFLKYAVDMLRARGGEIVNLDLIIICETPKIGPHREAMQERVAQICGIAPGRVGVKATTTERLGFTGRGEGIAAQALATVKII